MKPTLRQLQYVVAIAQTGQVGLAASQLNVSQPSLSAQLAEIEAELDVTLFRRGRGGAQITPAGEDVVRRARQILRDHQDLKDVARGGGIFRGRLRLGVLPSIGPYLLPGVVRALHAEHPDFRLIIREESTRDLDEGLRSGRLDMIISTPEDHPGLVHSDLFTERFWAAVALDDAIAEGPRQINLSDLAGQTFLSLGSRHRLSAIVGGLATAVGGRVTSEYEGTSLDAIRLMAAAGTGVAILPSLYTAIEARRGTDVSLHELSDPNLTRRIALIQVRATHSKEDTAFLYETLRSEGETLLSRHSG